MQDTNRIYLWTIRTFNRHKAPCDEKTAAQNKGGCKKNTLEIIQK